ncbi:MAG: trypsin-like peptidase domain-containing protein, partial [bacterium]
PMKSHCHSCGREYLTARALAGQAIACRSCGALNDGAGGPPPTLAESNSRGDETRRGAANDVRGARGARGAREPRIEAGAAFTIGSTPKPADPAKLAAIEVGAMREKLAVTESSKGWRGSRVVFALAVGAASVTALALAGIFVYRTMVMPDHGIDWVPSQRAVAAVDTPLRGGSAFLVESGDNLWLITSFAVIGSTPEVSATFRDPVTGIELLRLAGLRSKDIRVDRRLFGAQHDSISRNEESAEAETQAGEAPFFDVAVANVEMYRPQIEACGIEPLELSLDADIRTGARIVALGQVTVAAAAEPTRAPTHALFDGTISSVKLWPAGGGHLLTSARYDTGCAGGPILLESTREVAGVQLDPAFASGRRIALSPSEIATVIDEGVQLGALRRDLEGRALERTGVEVGVKEAIAWPTFAGFDAQILALEAQGWSIRGQDVLLTGSDGVAELTHTVMSRPSAQVAVAFLSREPQVSIEAGDFGVTGAVVATQILDASNPASRVVVGVDVSSGMPIAFAPATRMTVPV